MLDAARARQEERCEEPKPTRAAACRNSGPAVVEPPVYTPTRLTTRAPCAAARLRSTSEGEEEASSKSAAAFTARSSGSGESD